jgi:hypothetical protein
MDEQTRVHRSPVIRSLFFAAALSPLAGCAAAVPAPDAPAPAGEPRAVVRLHVDLVRAQDCEEAFDLALYQSRAVELLAWDPGGGRCDDRTVAIRYLSRKTSRDEVIRAASAVAAKVSAMPETNGAPR